MGLPRHYFYLYPQLEVCAETTDALLATHMFAAMDRQLDEDEHSIEMQLPYVALAVGKAGKLSSIRIVPILVGDMAAGLEQQYAGHLAPFLVDPQNFFVVSSDFCHWGQRFRLTLLEKGVK